MEAINKVVSTLKNSPIGAVVGGIAIFYAAKKYGKLENKWALGAIAVAGALIGSTVEYKVKAKLAKPAIAAKK
jgi:hypothetical protein